MNMVQKYIHKTFDSITFIFLKMFKNVFIVYVN